MSSRTITFSLKYTARALAACPAVKDKSQWIVGTNSLREENEIRILEYDELHESLKSVAVFTHASEVWDLAPCPSSSQAFISVNSSTGDFKATLWKGDGSSQLEPLAQLTGHQGPIRRALWHLQQHDLVVTVEQGALHKWSVSGAAVQHAGKASPGDLRELWSGALHPSNPNVCTTAGGNNIQIWDLQSMSKQGEISAAHHMPVRDVCFAPQQEHRLLSAGDDCKLRVWDMRSLGKPEALLELAGHSHWVWKAQYNPSYDSLIASSSSDSLAFLWHTPVLAGSTAKPAAGTPGPPARSTLSPASPGSREVDGKAHAYDEHDDSVYGLAWSLRDPWVFASLSYEGRVVVNQVPKNTKYRVML